MLWPAIASWLRDYKIWCPSLTEFTVRKTLTNDHSDRGCPSLFTTPFLAFVATKAPVRVVVESLFDLARVFPFIALDSFLLRTAAAGPSSRLGPLTKGFP